MKKSKYGQYDCMIIALEQMGLVPDQWVKEKIQEHGKGFPHIYLPTLAHKYNLLYLEDTTITYDQQLVNIKITNNKTKDIYYYPYLEQAMITNDVTLSAGVTAGHIVTVPLHVISVFKCPTGILLKRSKIVTKRKIT